MTTTSNPKDAHPTRSKCRVCGYQMETDDRYGCPNCHGDGLDDIDESSAGDPGAK
jgi:Zn finger protein HypA/HybF involved in hydrogenase expression